MLKFALLAAFLGVQLVAAVDYRTPIKADQEFLQKQKKIYNLLYHVGQPSVVNTDLYEQGLNYNIEANIDFYDNPSYVKEFLAFYNNGLLPRGEIFSVFYKTQLEQGKSLFRLFFHAKDFDTFYKTALWARIHVNEGMFVNSLYHAVMRREDTKYMQLPPIYEIYPYIFFNAEVIEKAHHAKIFGKLDKKTEGFDTYIIPANYSGWYMSREYDLESRLNYFTEDIGLNLFYYYFRQNYPFWLGGEECNFSAWRGEEYLYGHKQILNRYYLERLSNDIGKIEDFDWEREFYPGYYPTMTFHNGLPLPQRPHWSRFPYYKFKYIKDIQDYESRIAGAIDMGLLKTQEGGTVKLYSPQGISYLGNLIEGNEDSKNKDFYGSIDILGRKILGFNLDESSKYQIMPSALEYFSSSLRDPAFYRLYKRIVGYYDRYWNRFPEYKKEEVIYPDLKIESFAIDKLITYFDQFDTSISNGLLVENQNEADTTLIKVRQYRLNHKPFSYHLSLNANKPVKAAIRLYIGPKYDVNRKPIELEQAIKLFYEIDNYVLDLNAGANKIVRSSQEFFFTISDPEPSEIFYKRVLKALEGQETFSYYKRLYGFPERLLLPRGKKEGLPLQVYIHVSPVENEISYSSRIWGEATIDGRSCGYPLDRPCGICKLEGPNMLLKDVLIFHKDEADLTL